MFRDARRAYESGARTSQSNRELEAEALFKAARQLEDVCRTWSQPGRDARLLDAVRFNQRLWTLFQAELARASHPMPRALRQDLLRLSTFVERRLLEVLATPDAGRLAVVIEVNRQLAHGLKGEVAAAGPAS